MALAPRVVQGHTGAFEALADGDATASFHDTARGAESGFVEFGIPQASTVGGEVLGAQVSLGTVVGGMSAVGGDEVVDLSGVELVEAVL
jgi:hypothetical protein